MVRTNIRWPDFYIIGTSRGGTTTLYSLLKSHANIFLPKEKELRYFDKTYHTTIAHKKEEEYLSHFKEAKNNQLIGEASPNYLYEAGVDSKIRKKQKKAKFIISLRDPIERLISHILMVNRNHGNSSMIDEDVKLILSDKNHPFLKEGLYFDNIQRFIKTFGKENIHIIIFEEWIPNSFIAMNELVQFLKLDIPFKELNYKNDNGYMDHRSDLSKSIITHSRVRSIGKKIFSSEQRLKIKKWFLKKGDKPILSEELQESLVLFYKNDVDKIESYLNKKLPWKNFKS